MPRQWVSKEKNPNDSHDRGAAGQDRWNRRDRTAFLKKKKERDCPSAYTDTGNQRIIEPGCAEFLIPPPAEPQNSEINQDREGGAGFDNETAESLTNMIRRYSGEDLMCAVKHSSNNRVSEPGRDGTKV